MKESIEKKLAEVNELLKIQGSTGNWDYDPYMQGMFNGMEVVFALLEEREPNLRSAPKEWLKGKKIQPNSELTVVNLVAHFNTLGKPTAKESGE